MKTVIGALTMWMMCLSGTALIMLLLGLNFSINTARVGTAVFVALSMLRVALR